MKSEITNATANFQAGLVTLPRFFPGAACTHRHCDLKG